MDTCCSTSKPCVGDGRCKASCMKDNKRFQCVNCPPGHAGERCEIARNCAFYAHSSDKAPGIRQIMGNEGNMFPVYCHFTTKYAMTLMMSFTRKNGHDIYHNIPLYHSSERKATEVNFDDYRQSYDRMKFIKDYGSTHWIYTCDYQNRGYNENDYLRAKFSEIDVLNYRSGDVTHCTEKFEYINIRGGSCTDCSTNLLQKDDFIFSVIATVHLHCGGLVGTPTGSCSSGGSVRYFGNYLCYNSNHVCSASPESTTQLWFATYIGP